MHLAQRIWYGPCHRPNPGRSENRADPEIQRITRRFFKEEVSCYGIKTAAVIAIAKTYWKEVRIRDKQEIFGLCEELYRSGIMEEDFIVSNWVPNLAERFEPEDIAVFRHWIDTWITNWAACDSFCNHSVGDFIEKYPESVDELKRWTQSENRWMRRAAAVSLIVPENTESSSTMQSKLPSCS